MFSVADTVSKTDGGGFSGDVTFDSTTTNQTLTVASNRYRGETLLEERTVYVRGN